MQNMVHEKRECNRKNLKENKRLYPQTVLHLRTLALSVGVYCKIGLLQDSDMNYKDRAVKT